MRRLINICMAALVFGLTSAAADEFLFSSNRLTPKGEYTAGIEGPAVDATGNLFVVNYHQKGTVGRLRPGAEQSELFATLPAGSVGNGIRFSQDGRMYIADYRKHNVLVMEAGQTAAHVYFHSSHFNQPNDLAIAADGTLYASDPSFAHGSGQIWRIERKSDGSSGAVMLCDRKMGTTNGIDLSPDGKTLYVSESQSREVWAYELQGARLTSARLVKKFDSGELDGLRTDIDGKIFVTRPTKGTVAVLTSDGNLVREIKLSAANPTNLTFGGPDGKTVYVTQADGGYIESFFVDRPGR
ncbi:SMP-30/gluconolactonase/LRE family protein [Mesorhizobium calcicola]|uniref:SMP-30/gluconolactonase/LRE family protein n=1 Tax=Mesorhizobium calcicola TaxID=1300310 RepID=A0ABW4WJV9_9HYPH